MINPRLTAIAITSIALLAVPGAALATSGANARPATHSERAAVTAVFAREDGNASVVHSVYVSRSNSALAVACIRTPEAGTLAYVYTHSHGSWHYATSGRPGRAGNTADRQLEHACG